MDRNTKILYYDDYLKDEFTGEVLKVEGRKVVLHRTIFYPTSGGQDHDVGTINDTPVENVAKEDGVIIHVLEEKPDFEEGEKIKGKIDVQRRKQLTQHHTATHIINGAARRVLGDHVWQAGASKKVEKARIDITHFDSLTDKKLRRIEEEAKKVVEEDIEVEKTVQKKNRAEEKYGFRLYQGGAVPGRRIRVVNIPGVDVEACGGTHLDSTGEVEVIKVLKSSKVQDGVVRIEFTAGEAAKKIINERREQTAELEELLNTETDKIPSEAERLFKEWKARRKAVKKNQKYREPTVEIESFEGDVVEETAKRLETEPKNVVKTVKRFKKEIREYRRVEEATNRLLNNQNEASEVIENIREAVERVEEDLSENGRVSGQAGHFKKVIENLQKNPGDKKTIKKFLNQVKSFQNLGEKNKELTDTNSFRKLLEQLEVISELLDTEE